MRLTVVATFLVATSITTASLVQAQTGPLRYLSPGIKNFKTNQTLRAICIDGSADGQPCTRIKFEFDGAQIGPVFTSNEVLSILSSSGATAAPDTDWSSESFPDSVRIKEIRKPHARNNPLFELWKRQLSKMGPKERLQLYNSLGLQQAGTYYKNGNDCSCSEFHGDYVLLHSTYRNYIESFHIARIEKGNKKNEYWFVYIPNDKTADFIKYETEHAQLAAKAADDSDLGLALNSVVNSTTGKSKPVSASAETLNRLVTLIKNYK